jgi:mannose-6-phosphate isomerase
MDLAKRAERAQEWLLQVAWPFWAQHGLDGSRDGFHEALDHDNATCQARFRRLRVLTRQIFVFSRAAQYGFAPGEAIVALGLRRLKDVLGDDGLYPWRFDLDHRPIDHTRDLYDHAFVLLALSAAAPVVGADQVREPASHLIARIGSAFRHVQGGFVEALPPALPRRQNPHMHLLEAALAAHAAFANQQDALHLAIELGSLFLQRLFQPQSGVLAEFFDDGWAPERPILVEPGHHYEWVWLLHHLAPLSPDKAALRQAAERLYDFAQLYGICPKRRVVRDQLDENGTVLSDNARLWPQTERLKAELRAGDAAKIAEADDVLARYLAAGRPGLWSERMDAAGAFSREPAPASSLYHITGALTELIEVAGSRS